jgi:hypothetical protein
VTVASLTVLPLATAALAAAAAGADDEEEDEEHALHTKLASVRR